MSIKLSAITNQLLLISFLFCLSACGFTNVNLQNTNANSTNVLLSQKNFIVLDKVTGEASVRKILGFGGTSKKGLMQEAMAKMYADANLGGNAKTIINVTYETHTSFYIFVNITTVIASGYVIEFLK
ncbi:MAG: hypothetical protein IPO83_18150 [Chitinophagaceae bacterium]|nr:hypothetical protein [Chitinophagaceae bacterium]